MSKRSNSDFCVGIILSFILFFRHLSNKDTLSKSDPFIELLEYVGQNTHCVGKTEVIEFLSFALFI